MKRLSRALLAVLLTAVLAPAADEGLLSLVMPDARVISGMNVDRGKNSSLGQFLLSRMSSEDPGFQKFYAATGFDPRRDLREVLAASTGGPKGSQTGLILARGYFDSGRLSSLARTSGAEVTTYQGVEILTLPQGAASKNRMCLVFFDTTLAVAGDLDSVRGAIDRKVQGSRLGADVLAKVSELSNLYEIWGLAATPISELTDRMPNAQTNGVLQGEAFKSIVEMRGGMSLGANMEIVGEAETRSAKDATALVDVARFFTGMLQMNQQNPQAVRLAALFDSMQMSAVGNIARFSFSVPEGALEDFIRSARNRTAGIVSSEPQVTFSNSPTAPTAPSGNTDIVIHSSPKDMGVVTIDSPQQ